MNYKVAGQVPQMQLSREQKQGADNHYHPAQNQQEFT